MLAKPSAATSFRPAINLQDRIAGMLFIFLIGMVNALFNALTKKEETVVDPLIKLVLLDPLVVKTLSLVLEELRASGVGQSQLELVGVLEPQMVDQS